MKPHRIRMTHNLLLNYGLYRKMEIYVSNLAPFIIPLLRGAKTDLLSYAGVIIAYQSHDTLPTYIGAYRKP